MNGSVFLSGITIVELIAVIYLLYIYITLEN